MRMTAGLKASCAVLATTGLLVACAKLHWVVKYQDQDLYYSSGEAAALDAQGNAFLAGFIEPRDDTPLDRVSFVAKYDKNGKLLWERRFNASPDEPVRGVNHLLADLQGNLYVVELRFGAAYASPGMLVTKLDNHGNEIWQWYGPTESVFSLGIHAEIRADGNLYISSSYPGADLLALSQEGDLRWSKPFPIEEFANDDRGLSPYSGTTAAFVEGEITVRNLGVSLEVVNSSGEPLAQFDSAELGLDVISRAYPQIDAILVVGSVSGQLAARRILKAGRSFVPDTTEPLVLSPSYGLTSASPSGGFCFASRAPGNVIRTGYVDATLRMRWQSANQVVPAVTEVDVSGVEASAERCHAQYYAYAPGSLTTTVLAQDIATGNDFRSVAQEHFGPWDLAVQGNVILQAGITGPYTGTEGTAATLVKHTIR